MEAAEDVAVDNKTGKADEATAAAAAAAHHTPWVFHPHSRVASPHQHQRQRDKRQRQQTLLTAIVLSRLLGRPPQTKIKV